MWKTFFRKSIQQSDIHFTCPFRLKIRSNSTVRSIKFAKPQKYRQESAEAVKWLLFAIPVSSFGLGCWQVQRLKWKQNLVQTLQQKTNSSPVELPHDFSELESMEYLPVKVRGHFMHEVEILIGPRALIESETTARAGSLISDPKKNQGWLVVTPFKLSDSERVILVNRGWVPHKLKSPEMRQAGLIPGEVELTGVLRLTETRPPFMPKNNPGKGQWFYRDLDEMGAYVKGAAGAEGAEEAIVWLDARGTSDPPAGWPLPNQTRVTLRNEHFSYILTWYSLSAFTALMWYRRFVRKLPLL